MAKYGTQSATFLRVRFSNIKRYTDHWFTIGIAPTARTIPSAIPDDCRRHLRSQLLQRFIYLYFKHLIQASFNFFVIKGSTYILRFGIFIGDQPKELTLHALKRKDADMYCSNCTLQSRIRNLQPALLPRSLTNTSSTDKDDGYTITNRVSVSNSLAQLCPNLHVDRYPTVSFRMQLNAALHHIHLHVTSSEFSES